MGMFTATLRRCIQAFWAFLIGDRPRLKKADEPLMEPEPDTTDPSKPRTNINTPTIQAAPRARRPGRHVKKN
jgi:hypothetical protein